MNRIKLIACGVVCLTAGVASAGFEIALDAKAKPIKDMRTTGNGVGMGFNGAVEGWLNSIRNNDDILYVSNRLETARAYRQAGLRLMRLQGMNSWFNCRGPNPYDPNSKDPKVRKAYARYNRTNPKALLDFYKANGVKTFVCLECWSESAVTNNLEIVQWLVDNGYKDVVAGFEMGNESYASPKYPTIAPYWKKFIDGAEKIWPKIPLGLVLGEYMENDPDIAQIQQRMKSSEKLEHGWTWDTGYFSAGEANRNTANFVIAMSNYLAKIDHVIYHGYGAETPYSCSYYGFQRFRNFIKAYPQLQGKKYWLTETRLRSDEDNRCQRIFRETMLWAHYALMALCQPETDAVLQHQASALSGAIYQSDGRTWCTQWRDGSHWGGSSFPDFAAPDNRPRLEVGSMGVLYRLYTEAILEHPLFVAHGTSQAMNEEDTFFTSARVTDQVYKRRRAIREGRKSGGFLGIGADYPEVEGEVEYVAAFNAARDRLCLLMVNTKGTPETCRVTVAGRKFTAPAYRTLSCPAEFVDCRAIPGDGPVWRQMSWEDTQSGGAPTPMEPYNGMKPQCDVMTVSIAPHTVQTVTVPLMK